METYSRWNDRYKWYSNNLHTCSYKDNAFSPTTMAICLGHSSNIKVHFLRTQLLFTMNWPYNNQILSLNNTTTGMTLVIYFTTKLSSREKVCGLPDYFMNRDLCVFEWAQDIFKCIKAMKETDRMHTPGMDCQWFKTFPNYLCYDHNNPTDAWKMLLCRRIMDTSSF